MQQGLRGGVDRATARAGARRHLCSCASGTTAVEFALLAPVTILIIFVGIILAQTMYIQVLLDDAVIEAARYGSTGQSSDGSGSTGSRISDIANVVAHTGGGSNFGSLTAPPSTTYDSTQLSMKALAATDKFPDPINSVCPAPQHASTVSGSPGTGRQMVIYCLVYSNNALINSFLSLLGFKSYNMTLVATAVVQNEPF